MNLVSPIRDDETVKQVKREARKIGVRPYVLILLGLNTGLRISDLLKVTAGDIRKGFIILREQKTGKQTEIRVNPAVLSEIRTLTSTYKDDQPLAYSTNKRRKNRSVHRHTAYNWIQKACRRAGFLEPVGNHTMRKTFGYHYYMGNRNVAELMLMFNHSSEKITMRYIGITQEKINKGREKFRL